MICMLAAAILATEIPEVREITYVPPVKVLWQTTNDGSRKVEDATRLISARFGQVPEGEFWKGDGCLFTHNGQQPSLLLDFGRELHGGVEIGAGLYTEDKALTKSTVQCRFRFGESVTEAMSELKENGACNGHGMRDFVAAIPSTGLRVFGDTGFRFLRIDLLEPGTLQLDYVRAISKMRPLRQVGSFRSNDERLNAIFETSWRTARLCAQKYILDGIKRDRLVWAGDMYPQIRAILAVNGPDPVIIESLDYLGTVTPPEKWMCIPSYSMFWLLGLREWWFVTGKADCLTERRDYLKAMYANLAKYVGLDGRCTIENAVLDWPTRKNPAAAKDGHQALFSETFRIGGEMARAMKETVWAEELEALAKKTRLKGLDPHGAKSAAAMLSLYGDDDSSVKTREVLSRNGLEGLSPFFAPFVAEARFNAGDRREAVSMMRDYWGAMLDMGATSFWEAFDVAWTNHAVRIDELAQAGRPKIHGDFGEFCYKGCRCSLCHGWGAGPSVWLIEKVLGIRFLAPGGKIVEVRPFLGDLDWIEGARALPNGESVKVRVTRADGINVEAPDWVEVRVRDDLL